ncbi:128_t:CDS:2 [Entrophospora sp. SA101]|nr:128_t:CDS:2 [Entrophospora sp. SA101]
MVVARAFVEKTLAGRSAHAVMLVVLDLVMLVVLVALGLVMPGHHVRCAWSGHGYISHENAKCSRYSDLKGISLIPVKGEGAEGDEYLKTLGEILPSSIKILRLRTDKNEWKFTNEALKTFFESRKSNGPISLQMVSNSSSSSVRGYIDIIKKYHEEGALSEIRRLFYNKDHEPNWKPDAGFHLEESLDADNNDNSPDSSDANLSYGNDSPDDYNPDYSATTIL